MLIKNLTPRGGPGKLRNYWEEQIHTVVRQMGSDLPIYELRPEQGKGRSRVLHRNLLMPCDHLPFETPPKPATANKRKPRQERSQPLTSQLQDSDEDNEDEYDFHFVLPRVHRDRNVASEEHVQPKARPKPRAPAEEQGTGLQEQVAPSPPPNEDQVEELNLPAETPPADHIPEASPSSSATPDTAELAYQHPQRERRAPRRITYDELGTPTCYSVEQMHGFQPPLQPLPLYSLPGLVPWLPATQPYYYQQPYLYGLPRA